jgi:hypothetical protein
MNRSSIAIVMLCYGMVSSYLNREEKMHGPEYSHTREPLILKRLLDGIVDS